MTILLNSMSALLGGLERVRDGLRSPSISDEVAWQQAQVLLATTLESYQAIMNPPYDLIAKEVFKERRRACLTLVDADREAISQRVSGMMRELDDLTLDALTPFFVVVRDLFEVKSPTNRGPRPFKT